MWINVGLPVELPPWAQDLPQAIQLQVLQARAQEWTQLCVCTQDRQRLTEWRQYAELQEDTPKCDELDHQRQKLWRRQQSLEEVYRHHATVPYVWVTAAVDRERPSDAEEEIAPCVGCGASTRHWLYWGKGPEVEERLFFCGWGCLARWSLYQKEVHDLSL